MLIGLVNVEHAHSEREFQQKRILIDLSPKNGIVGGVDGFWLTIKITKRNMDKTVFLVKFEAGYYATKQPDWDWSFTSDPTLAN